MISYVAGLGFRFFCCSSQKATKGNARPGLNLVDSENLCAGPKPAVTEGALRLADVLELLTSEQPKCPQLYIYSSADQVIPAKSVESFIERQRRAGHEVRACDFLSSPHVDHFRNHRALYDTQLASFLDDCSLQQKLMLQRHFMNLLRDLPHFALQS
ncbi:transmembrane protein 53-A-like [Zingiber officinale]|uniref:transmembrane protein 53-A-like n=1 Tax=Zingiber officinale TaxID=94328 RepID=UPI001C4D3322|nr:transmembrane protein 53-A-like [Zingiber officinale]